MPDDLAPSRPTGISLFPPKALRVLPEDQRLIETLTERVFAAHPAWPWPLIDEEARRIVDQLLAERSTW